MDPYIPINIDVARDIALTYSKCQVVISVYDDEHEIQQVVTYGITPYDSLQACEDGNSIKRLVLEWPEGLCESMVDKTYEPEKWD